MPAVPPPDDLPDWDRLRAEQRGFGPPRDGPLELRACDPDEDFQAGVVGPPRRRLWFRPRGSLPADPPIHAALLVYASDRTLLGTGARPHGLAPHQLRNASLDHAMHLHHPARFDDWVLYDAESPVAESGRALVQGAMYSRAGIRLASVTQEGLIRRVRPVV